MKQGWIVAMLGWVVAPVALAAEPPTAAESKPHPLAADKRAKLAADFAQEIADLTARIAKEPTNVGLYSDRGSSHFFAGQFAASLADFDKMIELRPDLKPGHWRRGITLYYLGRYQEGADQFEIYHTEDAVDRENGLWRFMCQSRVHGLPHARANMLKYERSDRPPFVALYDMFLDKLTPEQVVQQIEVLKIAPEVQQRILFYAHLYVGIYHDLHGRREQALDHLRQAVANPWAQEGAGGGAGYMWQTARVHYNFLTGEYTAPK